jgi:hypothetical protein
MVWPFSSPKSQSPQQEPSKDALKDDVPPKKPFIPPMSDEARDRRRRKLMDAINENCALESAALLECQDSWSLWNRMTLCQAFQSNYMDCLNTQRVDSLSSSNVDSRLY